MKKLFLMAVAAIAALSSCTSDNDLELNQNTAKEALTFTATIEGSEATRATFDKTNKCAAWEEGDEIYVIDYNWKNEGARYKAGSDGTTTTFTASESGKEAKDAEEGFEAYFPASIVTSYDESQEDLCLVLPSEIEEEYGHFNMPMYGVSDESSPTKLNFTNLCGVLAITVKSDQMESVKSIRVSSSNLAMSGLFTVMYMGDYGVGAGLVGSDAGNPNNTVTVKYTDEGGVETGTAGKTFYVAIPHEIYTELKIELSSDGTNYTKTMTTKEDKEIFVKRNKIYPITFKDNSAAPTNQINGHEYVELAGYYWATENVYNATATEGGKVGSEEYGSYYVQNEAINAAASWGGTWTLPTAAQWQALLDGCTWTWKTDYEFGGTKMNGYLVSDKTDSSKFIFLPAAGYSYQGGNIFDQNQRLLYWSSTVNNINPETQRGTYLYYTGSGSPYIFADQNELTGFSVRPVAATLKPIKGTAKATINSVETDVKWVQLWENGPKFAEYNVGVTDGKAESYGEYYTWAEDVASTEWGSAWRMPTKAELEALINNCDFEWTTVNDVSGHIYTGKGAYSSNSIFRP